MRQSIEKTLIVLESGIDFEQPDPASLSGLMVTLPAVQQDYERVMAQSLQLLTQGQRAEFVEFLQLHRDELDAAFNRAAILAVEIQDSTNPVLRHILEYLHSRIRLLDELRMSPDFGLELLSKLGEQPSIEQSIFVLEKAMTGKESLYEALMEKYSSLS